MMLRLNSSNPHLIVTALDISSASASKALLRTSRRPLPSGRITIPHAVGSASSVGLAGRELRRLFQTNMLAAGLAASNLILWAAASNDISLNAMILPVALYFWKIPHFMALAYLCRDDFAAGGFKMYSLADASGHRISLVALGNSMYLIPLGFLAYDSSVARATVLSKQLKTLSVCFVLKDISVAACIQNLKL
ncbi:hypothetical protein JHK84_029812 [Glycine max]|nr:hypothetical protein JHK84_029812 [Glycine max]